MIKWNKHNKTLQSNVLQKKLQEYRFRFKPIGGYLDILEFKCCGKGGGVCVTSSLSISEMVFEVAGVHPELMGMEMGVR